MGKNDDDGMNTHPDGRGEKEDAANQAGLSAQLRGLYQGLLDEPIPDRFMQLLQELESKEEEQKK
jgi:hypothetical protein